MVGVAMIRVGGVYIMWGSTKKNGRVCRDTWPLQYIKRRFNVEDMRHSEYCRSGVNIETR